MRSNLLHSAALILSLSAGAGTAFAQISSWDNVQHLHAKDGIRVHSSIGRGECEFIQADADTLTCNRVRHVFFVPTHQKMVFHRADVIRIRTSREAASTLAGAGIGLAAGAATGAGIDAGAKGLEDGHLATVVFAFLGTLIGCGVGSHTDFLAGPVIYRAP